MFSGEPIAACGFSLGLERIIVVMTERTMFPQDLAAAAAEVLVTLFDGEPIEEALRLARELRDAGLRVDVYPEPDKLGKQFKYAAARGVKLVTVAGADERARGEITVKDMVNGEQVSLPRTDAAASVSRLLSRSGHDGHKEHEGH